MCCVCKLNLFFVEIILFSLVGHVTLYYLHASVCVVVRACVCGVCCVVLCVCVCVCVQPNIFVCLLTPFHFIHVFLLCHHSLSRHIFPRVVSPFIATTKALKVFPRCISLPLFSLGKSFQFSLFSCRGQRGCVYASVV